MSATAWIESLAQGCGLGRALAAARDKLPLPRGRSSDRGDPGSGDSADRVTTIVEEVDVGVPVALTYDQWTELGALPSWWSRRGWRSTILEQRPERIIVWRSEGRKGYVDGVVTFHELAPDLTRIVVVVEYRPQGRRGVISGGKVVGPDEAWGREEPEEEDDTEDGEDR